MNNYWDKISLKRTLLLIAACFVFANNTEAQLYKKNSDRPDLFYYGLNGGGNISILQGAVGSLRKAYINDFTQYMNDRGYDASGYLNPGIGFNAGIMGGYNFAKRFSLESSLNYTHRGFKEEVSYYYEDSTHTVFYNSYLKAHLDYIDFTLGVRYKHYSGITVFTGFVSGLNIVDNVFQKTDYEVTYPNFPTANLTVNQDSILFIHQYYGVNRKIYLPAYVWSIGYSSKRYLDINFIIEKSSNIFVNDQRVDPNFLTLKLNVVCRIDYFERRRKGYSH